ncbi:MAG TPA: hypothetical protein VF883_06230 [Thermoanaerobaculia bacterium]|jgi:hypothetical protein
MSEYDKELQSNTKEFDEAIEPLERETHRETHRTEQKETDREQDDPTPR